MALQCIQALDYFYYSDCTAAFLIHHSVSYHLDTVEEASTILTFIETSKLLPVLPL